MGLPDDVMEKFVDKIQGANLVFKATNSKVTADMVRATLARTWYIVPNGTSIQSPATGSRPGDPLADVLFAFLMSEVMDCLHCKFLHHGLYENTDTHELPQSNMVAWVDDLAVAVFADATQLVSKVAHTAALVKETMQEHGFQLSTGCSKTAVVLAFHGKHAVRARQESEAKCGKGIPVLNEYI